MHDIFNRKTVIEKEEEYTNIVWEYCRIPLLSDCHMHFIFDLSHLIWLEIICCRVDGW